MHKKLMTLLKRVAACIVIILLLNLALNPGLAAAASLAEARDTITRTKPEDQAIQTAKLPEKERGAWSRYGWWIVGGLVLAAGGAAAALAGGSSGSSTGTGESGGEEIEIVW